MAVLSISTEEIFERGREFKIMPNYIKDLHSENGEIVAKIEVNRLLPDLKIKVSFEEFNFGRAIFKIQSPAVIKLPAKLIRKDFYKDIITLEKGKLIFDINKAIMEKTDKIQIKEVSYTNELFTVKI